MEAIKQRVQLFTGKHPRIYYNFYGLKPKNRRLAVDGQTQLVIEGFPRSANTFAVVAFEHAQKESVSLAHHLHVPAQVIRAARWRIPTLVLIREPADAILSLMVRHPEISAGHALKHYILFYETVAEYSEACVLGRFEEVTEVYGAVIERINERFGTDFVPFETTGENIREVFNRVEEINRVESEGLEEQVARPSAARKELKAAARTKLEAPAHEATLARAGALYRDLTGD